MELSKCAINLSLVERSLLPGTSFNIQRGDVNIINGEDGDVWCKYEGLDLYWRRVSIGQRQQPSEYVKEALLDPQYVYLVTAPHFDAVKIGYSKQCPCRTMQRYKTLLGSKMIMFFAKVIFASFEEKRMHSKFSSKRIEGELFKKEDLISYLQYLKDVGQIECKTNTYCWESIWHLRW